MHKPFDVVVTAATVGRVLDPKRLRSDLDGVRNALARRGVAVAEVDRLAALDAAARTAQAERDRCRAEVKGLSKEVGAARQAGDAETADRLQARSRALGDAERVEEAKAAALEAELRDALLLVPNEPASDAPDGAGPQDNVVLSTWTPDGHPFDENHWAPHQCVPHWETGAQLGLIDGERAVKMSGSMFTMYRGQGARLLRALTGMALDRHVAGGWEEIRPPTLVTTATLTSTGHLPKFADDAYHLARDDLWAIPTAEVPLTSLGRDEVFDPDDLPKLYTAYTSCYRREAGSAGRDTRGLLRTHEFDKVELMAVATPGQVHAIHADILRRAEDLLRDLGLTYRVLDLCAGDLGFASRRTFDLEVYAPGVGAWLEVSSVSWYGDFQARRANMRHRVVDADGKPAGTAVCHTLNGSALAWPRVIAALLEVHREEDGRIALPAVLQARMGATHIG